MRISGIGIVMLGLLFSMCVVQRPVSGNRKAAPSDSLSRSVADSNIRAAFEDMRMPRHYSREMAPSYFYIEGLKMSAIHNDIIAAARYFDMAIELDSTHSPSHYAAANNVLVPDPELALRYSRAANRLDTANLLYKEQLGYLLFLTGNYSEAGEIYTYLLKHNPTNNSNYIKLAVLLELNGDTPAAIALLEDAESKLGKVEELSAYKRDLFMKMGMPDRALEESVGLTEVFPHNYENFLSLGRLYSATGNDSLALINYRRAQELNPDGLDVLALMNEFYKRRNDNINFLSTTLRIFRHRDMDVESKIGFFEDITQDKTYYAANYYMISELAEALKSMYPDNPGVIELYAANKIAAGYIEEALAYYKTHLDDDAGIEIYNEVLDIEAYLMRVDSVNKYSAEALVKFPDNAELHIRKGAALSYLKQTEEAMQAYEQALKYAANDTLRSSVLGMIGDEYHTRGDLPNSFKYYEQALKLNPDNIIVLNNYAYFLSLEGRDLDKALRMAEKVMESEPGNPTYIDTYGWVLYKMGRFEEAKKALQMAVSLEIAGSGELIVHYGDILYELGDRSMAEYYWKKALKEGYDKAEIENRLNKIGQE